jgi:hypothetical protein
MDKSFKKLKIKIAILSLRSSDLIVRYAVFLGIIFVVFYGLIFHATVTLGRTVVTNYITQVQEERQDTRFTLTQWLLIKERMRMMDLWLAMFTEPNQSKFRPELSLSYFKTNSNFNRLPKETLQGKNIRGQLWLTNLISSKVGVRMLNVDIGGGFEREEHSFQGGIIPSGLSQIGSQSNGQIPSVENESGSRSNERSQGVSRLQSFMGNLRLFGKHIQDSSLVLKYGEYRYQGFDPTGISLLETITSKGPLLGAELTIYVSSWLGLNGQYQTLGMEPTGSQSGLFGADLSEGQLFIEVSLLRLTAGGFQRRWTSQESKAKGIEIPDVKQSGVLTGLQLNL